MKISLNWIKQFAEISKESSDELSKRISVSLTEVESTENFRGVDTVFEIENKALTHRPDCFSHLGIAREVAAMKKTEFKNPLPKLNKKKLSFPQKGVALKVRIENPTICPRYTAVVLKNITINPSPLPIQERLLACGIKPINNVVDITNFVMLELGQPLHAFDFDKVKSAEKEKEIVVRQAKRNERITTLDGIQRELKSEMIVIADTEKSIAIAGVMGGTNTQVSDDTKTVIIESANFSAPLIRRCGKITGLHTEATLRFEKGQDPELTYPALIEAILLLQKYAKAKIGSKIIDVYPHKQKPKTITLHVELIKSLLGIEIKFSEMKKILERLECKVSGDEKDMKVTIPTFRNDLNNEQDFLEEIVRLYGYDKVVPTLPKRTIAPISNNLKRTRLTDFMKLLTALGFNEIYSYTFVSDFMYKKAKMEEIIPTLLSLKNPISPELRYVRNSLFPSLMEKVEINSHGFEQFGLFELGKEIKSISSKKLPEEKHTLCGVWYSKTGKDNCYLELKGVLELGFSMLGLNTKITFEKLQESPAYLENHKTAVIKLKNEVLPKEGISKCMGTTESEVGMIGMVHNDVMRNFDLTGCAVYFRLDSETLFAAAPGKTNYHPLPKFPSVFEDISFIIEENIPVAPLISTITSTDLHITNVTLKEVPFISEKFGAHKKSVAFMIEYTSSEKTLNSLEIKPIRQKIIQKLKKEYQATIRQ